MSKHKLKAKIIVYLSVDDILIGSKGLVMLLEKIRETGSLNKASKELGLSYRKAWSKIRFAEMKGSVKLVNSPKGRKGSSLTPEAIELLEKYKETIKQLKEQKLI